MPIPEGFQPHDRRSPLTAPWEPIFARRELDRVRLDPPPKKWTGLSRSALHLRWAEISQG